jgi:hypothetical protein
MLYQTIRDNGGWDNWKMEPIMEYPCESLLQARIKEQECLSELKSQLNSCAAHGDYFCELCDYSTKLKSDFKKHLVTRCHLICAETIELRKRHDDLKRRHDEMIERHDEMRKRQNEIIERREESRRKLETEIDELRKNHQKEMADMRKSPKYDSIEDVRTGFFLNSMFLNETKKEYDLQDFGKWVVKNRFVCKEIVSD